MLSTVSIIGILAASVFPPVTGPIVGETSEGVSASIAVRRSNLQVAPESMGFSVTNLVGWSTAGSTGPKTYDPQLHEIYYYWTFGDAGKTYDKLVNALPHQKDANRATGPIASHVFDVGNYVVTCFMVEPSSGKYATLSFKIGGTGADTPAVQDPDVVFAGNLTTYVDPDSDYTAAPAGAVLRTSFTDALAYNVTTTTAHRIMMSAGKTHNTGGNKVRGDFENNKNIYICAAAGARPTIKQTSGSLGLLELAIFSQAAKRDAIITGVALSGSWNPLTESYEPDRYSFWALSNDDRPVDYLSVTDCVIKGFPILYNTFTTDVSITGTFFLDCELGNWASIGAFAQGGETTMFAFRGNAIVMPPNALAGGNKGGTVTNSHNEHGAIRTQRHGPLDISQNDMFCAVGWVQNLAGFRTQQSILRICQSGTFTPVVNIGENSLEGGWDVISMTQQDAHSAIHLQNMVVDGNILVGGHMTTGGIALHFGGVTIRNNLFVNPNVARTDSGIFNPSYFVRTDPPATTARATGTNDSIVVTQADVDANLAAPVNVYNNTVVVLTTNANTTGTLGTIDALGPSVTERFTNKTVTNNIVHAPNLNSPINAGPLDTTPIFQARMLGYRSKYERIDLTLASPVPNGGTFTVPYPSGRVAADYAADTSGTIDPHQLWILGGGVQSTATTGQPTPNIGVSFGETLITVTNLSGATFAATNCNFVLYAGPNPPPTLTQYASPANFIASYRPLTGSPSIGTATTGSRSHRDAQGVSRPASATKGWLEPT